jgi:signal transduction histidine kinase
MERLIAELLTLAREGETATRLDAVALDPLAADAWGTVGTDTGTLAVVDDVAVEATPDRLRRLLENLFRNAVTHAGPDVTVTVGALADADGFYVEDDGHGIPIDDREAVFEPGVTTAESGTGFGLTIVKRIAEAHDWTVTVETGTDGGARFVFTGVETTPLDAAEP